MYPPNPSLFSAFSWRVVRLKLRSKFSVAGRQVSGWGELVRCTSIADIIGPRIQITEDGADSNPCSAISFGTVPVLQACVRLRLPQKYCILAVCKPFI